jgi:deoxyribodipyrimidine photolyase
MATEPIRRAYVDVEWDYSPEGRARLKAWQKGQTGFPLVDAGGSKQEGVSVYG